MKKVALIALAAASGGFVAGVLAAGAKKTPTTTTAADVKWTPMDEKAGDKGPQMAVVFGDLKKKAPIGWMLKTPAGFKPGPHTHTSDDYGVVVSGSWHNFAAPGTDEGPALTAGANWYQPGGQAHDNACDASSKDGCVVFVYMPNGFDFKPWTDPKAPKAGPGSAAPAKK